ncbi:hypothetical protein BLNAU_25249 [Blattamonas nauphoetae]|uniref:Uncharacterized protein n=1 Tax=Blattamonas nauphoetae TaxID=2049346 RepID=A0ABQ9WK56_9EUKA|nr:hypothetical protein BLNAU_25249 [Blattamonas nauphoetae]
MYLLADPHFQIEYVDVAARRAQAIAEEEEESIVPPPSTPKSQQSRMLFALSTPTRQTPQRVKTEDKVEKMLRNQMSGAVNPGEITLMTSPTKRQKYRKRHSTVRCALGVLDSLHRGGPTPQAIHSAISDSVNLVKNKTDSRRARASTCAAIELKDIERIVCLKGSSVLLITIRLRKMKGYHVQDSVVTVEGDIFAYSNLNVVYWLQQHLVQRFGLSLTSRDEWEQHWNLGERIWPIGPDAMTVRLQNRAFQADLATSQKRAREEIQMLIDPPPPEPRTPPPERSLLLQALLTPSRATPKRSKTAEKAEERLRSEMSGALHPGIITYSMDEPQETGQDQTQSPGILNDSVTSSPEEEMSRYLAFVEEIPEIVTKRKHTRLSRRSATSIKNQERNRQRRRRNAPAKASDDSTDSELLEESIHKVKDFTRITVQMTMMRAVVVVNEEGRKDSTDSTALEEAIIQPWKSLRSENDRPPHNPDQEAEWNEIYKNHRRIISRITPPVPEQSDNPSLSRPFNQNQGPTRLHTFLTKVSIDQLKNPQAHAVPFSPETQENHRWIYRMLKDFGDASNLDSVLPLQETVVREFIYALGINDLVCIPALDSTIRGGLVALDTLHRGERTPDNIRIAIAQTISLVKEENEIPDFSIGKPPLLATDLHKILSQIPIVFLKSRLSAAFSCFPCVLVLVLQHAAVALKDIERIVCLRDSSVLLITLRLQDEEPPRSRYCCYT